MCLVHTYNWGSFMKTTPLLHVVWPCDVIHVPFSVLHAPRDHVAYSWSHRKQHTSLTIGLYCVVPTSLYDLAQIGANSLCFKGYYSLPIQVLGKNTNLPLKMLFGKDRPCYKNSQLLLFWDVPISIWYCSKYSYTDQWIDYTWPFSGNLNNYFLPRPTTIPTTVK